MGYPDNFNAAAFDERWGSGSESEDDAQDRYHEKLNEIARKSLAEAFKEFPERDQDEVFDTLADLYCGRDTFEGAKLIVAESAQ